MERGREQPCLPSNIAGGEVLHVLIDEDRIAVGV